jgi:hypothetical protein
MWEGRKVRGGGTGEVGRRMREGRKVGKGGGCLDPWVSYCNTGTSPPSCPRCGGGGRFFWACLEGGGGGERGGCYMLFIMVTPWSGKYLKAN